MALHARRAGRRRPAAAPVARARRAGRERVRRGRRRRRPAAAVHHGRRPRRASAAPTSCGRGRTCTSTARLPPARRRVRLDGHGARCCRGSQARPRTRTPTSRTRGSSARAGSSENTAYHAFLVPTFETGRLAGLGHDPAGAPARDRVARGTPYAGRPTPSELSRTTTAGTSAPARSGDFEYLVRLLQPRPVDQRVGTRDMDVQRPGAEPPGDRRPDARRRARASAARCACRDATSTRPTLAGAASAYENWDRPVPAPVPARARRVRRPRRRLRGSRAPRPRTTHRPRPGVRRPRPAHHAAALRPLARADAAAARRPRRRRRSTPTTTGCTSSTSTRATACAAGFGTRVVQASQEDVHGRRLGADRRRARARTRASAPRSSRARSSVVLVRPAT